MGSRPWDADYGGKNTLDLAGATFNRRPAAAFAAPRAAAASAPQERREHTHPPTRAVYSDLLKSDRLRQVSELPRCFQPLFTEFSFFNSVQSEMLDFVLSTSRSFVVSASPPYCKCAAPQSSPRVPALSVQEIYSCIVVVFFVLSPTAAPLSSPTPPDTHAGAPTGSGKTVLLECVRVTHLPIHARSSAFLRVLALCSAPPCRNALTLCETRHAPLLPLYCLYFVSFPRRSLRSLTRSPLCLSVYRIPLTHKTLHFEP